MSDSSGKFVVRVYHAPFGCDTGCCGHIVEIVGTDHGAFEFTHPGDRETPAEFARALAEEVIARLWPDCLASIDWSSLQWSDVQDH